MNESVDFAQKFLEDMLSYFGLNVAVQATHNDEVIELDVPSTSINPHLIGHRGDTLRALQSLVSSALRSGGYEVTRVTIDVAGYKKKRFEKIEDETKDWIEQVRKSGEEMELRPLNAAERRVVHNTVSEYGGVVSESRGIGTDRRLFILPKEDDSEVEQAMPSL